MNSVAIFILLSLLVSCCHGDFSCLCNYNVETPVYKSADTSTHPIGYLYEFDCKFLLSEDIPLWTTIAFEHKIGFIENNGGTKIQICPGKVPAGDRLPTTSVPTTRMSITTLKAASPSATKATDYSSSFSSSVLLTTATPSSSVSFLLSSKSPISSQASSSETIRTNTPFPFSTFPSASQSNPYTMPSYKASSAFTKNITTTFSFSPIYPTKISVSSSPPFSGTRLITVVTSPNTGSAANLVSNSNTTTFISSIQRLTTSNGIQSNINSSNTLSAISSGPSSANISTTLYNLLSTSYLTSLPSANASISRSTKLSSMQTDSSFSVTSPHMQTVTEISPPNITRPEINDKLSSYSPSSEIYYTSGFHSNSTKFTHASVKVSSLFTSAISTSSINKLESNTTSSEALLSSNFYEETTTPVVPYTQLPETSVITSVASLTSPFGITFSANRTVTQSYIINSIKPDPVTDRVDLCPYENLRMSIYNKTTYKYPLFRQYDNYCYELRLELGSWLTGQRDCVDRGGELAIIKNEEVQARVYNLSSSLQHEMDVWIGLHDLYKESRWEWVDGEKLTKSSFNNGILINRVYTDARDCVLMDGSSGVWKNAACHSMLFDIHSHPWVCQYKIT